jgi:hypothetical protein
MDPALTTGAVPAGSSVTIKNAGSIIGAGGAGGSGGNGNRGSSRCCGRDGLPGGTAIELTVPATLQNTGFVFGGGGGGAGYSGCGRAAGGGRWGRLPWRTGRPRRERSFAERRVGFLRGGRRGANGNTGGRWRGDPGHWGRSFLRVDRQWWWVWAAWREWHWLHCAARWRRRVCHQTQRQPPHQRARRPLRRREWAPARTGRRLALSPARAQHRACAAGPLHHRARLAATQQRNGAPPAAQRGTRAARLRRPESRTRWSPSRRCSA